MIKGLTLPFACLMIDKETADGLTFASRSMNNRINSDTIGNSYRDRAWLVHQSLTIQAIWTPGCVKALGQEGEEIGCRCHIG